ncbi:c-type cytochrome [Flavobacterium lindanitolerans]|uniref:Cytochrome c n=1 Tax=Flavobacterium lindanitolerans TaxID=428988 RepID=A0A497V9T8_9FLAO|nr:c-type cytochrome [Flavobacterium lindanitolerans]MBC8643487.1 c-type cytochrome [Flavobacterium lindanitolerans]PKW28813.1 cytochrome c [Flavobacterium lindanitolerans]RLJ35684.1 cytochrome c [Flavobacterium lindanitolerans]
MKNLFFILPVLFLISCQKEQKKESLYPEKTLSAEEKQLELGREIFDGKGMCYSCHKPDQKVIGPSITEIAKIYKEKNADIKLFLKEKSEPIVDPSQYSVMKTNFAITKTFSDEELKAVEAYFYSHLKNEK